jgi:hypothetical protein
LEGGGGGRAEGGGGEAEAWHGGWLWCLNWRNRRVIGGEREESKSQLEGVLGFFSLSFFSFVKWKQDYRSLSPTEGIFPPS